MIDSSRLLAARPCPRCGQPVEIIPFYGNNACTVIAFFGVRCTECEFSVPILSADVAKAAAWRRPFPGIGLAVDRLWSAGLWVDDDARIRGCSGILKTPREDGAAPAREETA